MTEEEVKAYLEKMGDAPRNFDDEPYEVRKYLIEEREREMETFRRRLEEKSK
jgi:hypothetical protein